MQGKEGGEGGSSEGTHLGEEGQEAVSVFTSDRGEWGLGSSDSPCVPSPATLACMEGRPLARPGPAACSCSYFLLVTSCGSRAATPVPPRLPLVSKQLGNTRFSQHPQRPTFGNLSQGSAVSGPRAWCTLEQEVSVRTQVGKSAGPKAQLLLARTPAMETAQRRSPETLSESTLH